MLALLTYFESYQPPAYRCEHIAKMADADLFVYVGGGSHERTIGVVEATANPDPLEQQVENVASVGPAI